MAAPGLEDLTALSDEIRLLPPAEALPLKERLETFILEKTAEYAAHCDEQTATLEKQSAALREEQAARYEKQDLESKAYYDTLRKEQAARNEKQDLEHNALRALVDEALYYVPPVSNARLGRQYLEVMERCGKVTNLAPTSSPGEASILCEEEQSLGTLSRGAWDAGSGLPAFELSMAARLAALRLPPPGVGAAVWLLWEAIAHAPEDNAAAADPRSPVWIPFSPQTKKAPKAVDDFRNLSFGELLRKGDGV
jgi:hypothetical protein